MWFASFLLKAAVRRVNRRWPMRIVRLLRSMWPVCEYSGFGWPDTAIFWTALTSLGE